MNLQERIEKLEKELAEMKAGYVIKPWEPQGGEWCVNGNGDIVSAYSTKRHSQFGTERQTEELAERASDMMRRFNRLLAYHDEFCPEHDPAGVWDGTTNYTVYLSSTNTWQVYEPHWCMLVGVYFPKDIAEELCRKLNSGEVVL